VAQTIFREVELEDGDLPPRMRKVQYSDPPEPKPPRLIELARSLDGSRVTASYARRRRVVVLCGTLPGCWWTKELKLGSLILDLTIPLDVLLDAVRQEKLTRGAPVHDNRRP